MRAAEEMSGSGGEDGGEGGKIGWGDRDKKIYMGKKGGYRMGVERKGKGGMTRVTYSQRMVAQSTDRTRVP